MAISIVNNTPALSAARQFEINNINISKTIKRLSTGLRINSAADDAAGLAVANRLDSERITLVQGIQNAQDGISMVQTSDGGLQTIQQLLQRAIVLASEAANGLKPDDDRKLIQLEFDQIKEEINRIAQTTKFDKTTLLDSPLQPPPTTPEFVELDIGKGTGDWAGRPLFSPTGNKIAFHGTYNGIQEEVFIKNLFSGEIKRLTNRSDTQGGTNFLDDWSWDGTKIIVRSYPFFNAGGNSVLYIINSDGTELKQLTNPSFIARAGSFSPDGNRIVYATNETGTWTINIMNIDGSGKTIITTGDFPRWSPDGKKIAYLDSGTIKTIDLKTNASTTILSSPSGTFSWSPDGVFIAYTIPSEKEIRLIKADGTESGSAGKILVQSTGLEDVLQPVFTPDGRSVLYSWRGNDPLDPDEDTRVWGNNIFGVPSESLSLHIGAHTGEIINVNKTNATIQQLGITGIDLTNPFLASRALEILKGALMEVAKAQAVLGAQQNRVERTIQAETIYHENLTASESRIRDLDMAKETTEFAKKRILTQSSSAMLAQANLLPQVILQLLK